MPVNLYRLIKSGGIKVNRNSPAVHRFWFRVNQDGPVHPTLGTACWLWTGSIGGPGYGQLSVGGRPTTTHTYSWKLHRGPIPEGLWVLHHCDVQHCVRPSHLFLGTQQDNIADQVAKGRQVRGEKSYHAVLSEEIVRKARLLYVPWSRTHGVVALAKLFGVSATALYEVVNGNNWKHVT